MGIGDHVRPRHRRLRRTIKRHTVTTSIVCESPKAVLPPERRHQRDTCVGRFTRVFRRHERRRNDDAGMWTIQLRPKVAAEHHRRHRVKQPVFGRTELVPAQQERAARQYRRETPMHLIEVTVGMFIDDDHIRTQALEPPVLLRAQHLLRHRDVGLRLHAHQHDRQIARDRVFPQPGLPERVGRACFGCRTK